MTTLCDIVSSFYAVGQGLFSTGRIRCYDMSSRHNSEFNWVFDCGTSSKRKYLSREISLFEKVLDAGVTRDTSVGSIDLFCLSHFDEDHINGARELLEKRRINILVMPYYPLIERIRIALSSDNPSNDFLTFLVDPKQFLERVAGDKLGKIVMVAGVDGRTPEEPTVQTAERAQDRQQSIKIMFPKKGYIEIQGTEHLKQRAGSESSSIMVYDHNVAVSISDFWEFKFYNSYIPIAEQNDTVEEIGKIVDEHFANGRYNATPMLRQLKTLYGKRFGTSSIAKNAISLVSYNGPLRIINLLPLDYDRNLYFYENADDDLSLADNDFRVWRHYYRTNVFSDKIGGCYFGDFPLDSPEKLTVIKEHFGTQRWDRIEILQVPHHGSAKSWFAGASSEFNHIYSVCSSRRVSNHFPSKTVLNDLSTHGVVLVNEMQRVHFPRTFSKQ